MNSIENKDNASPITDVIHFFSNATKAYLSLESNVLKLMDNMPTYSPQQVFEECAKINSQRNSLNSKDQQVLDILNLAGKEIANQQIINDYQIALAKANIASNLLYDRLHQLRNSLQEQANHPKERSVVQ